MNANPLNITITIDAVVNLNSVFSSGKPSPINGQTVKVLGYNAPYDAGDPWELIYRATGRTGITPNGGFYIVGSKSDDYWEAVDKSVAWPDRFGAVGDGVTDDSVAWHNTINSGAKLVMAGSSANYLVRALVIRPSNSGLTIDLNGSTLTRIKYTDNGLVRLVQAFQVTHPSGIGTVAAEAGTMENITIKNGTLDVDMSTAIDMRFEPTASPASISEGTRANALELISGETTPANRRVKNICIENMRAINCGKSGFIFDDVENLRLLNCSGYRVLQHVFGVAFGENPDLMPEDKHPSYIVDNLVADHCGTILDLSTIGPVTDQAYDRPPTATLSNLTGTNIYGRTKVHGCWSATFNNMTMIGPAPDAAEIATALAGAPAWNSGTDYGDLAIVTHTGSYWAAKVDPTVGSEPTTANSFTWREFTAAEVYSTAANTYPGLEIVNTNVGRIVINDYRCERFSRGLSIKNSASGSVSVSNAIIRQCAWGINNESPANTLSNIVIEECYNPLRGYARINGFKLLNVGNATATAATLAIQSAITTAGGATWSTTLSSYPMQTTTGSEYILSNGKITVADESPWPNRDEFFYHLSANATASFTNVEWTSPATLQHRVFRSTDETMPINWQNAAPNDNRVYVATSATDTQIKLANSVEEGNRIVVGDTLATAELVTITSRGGNMHNITPAFANAHSVNEQVRVIGKDDPITPEMFGAIGNGVADDSAAVLAALQVNAPVHFADGKTYLLSSWSEHTTTQDLTLILGENTVIKGDVADTFIRLAEGYTLNIKGGVFDTWDFAILVGTATTQHEAITIKGTKFINMARGLNDSGTQPKITSLVVENCEFDTISAYGILSRADTYDHVNIANNRFTNIGGTNTAATAIHVSETNGGNSGTINIKENFIDGVTTTNNLVDCHGILVRSRGYHIQKNHIINCNAPHNVGVIPTVDFVNSNPDTITRASGSWITDGFLPDTTITVSSATNAANNGTYLVASVTALTITLDAGAALTADTSDATAKIQMIGQDDEAIYTTGEHGDISDNTVVDSSHGEGIIIAKGNGPVIIERNMIISTDSTINREAAISSLAPDTIIRNNSIEGMERAIVIARDNSVVSNNRIRLSRDGVTNIGIDLAIVDNCEIIGNDIHMDAVSSNNWGFRIQGDADSNSIIDNNVLFNAGTNKYFIYISGASGTQSKTLVRGNRARSASNAMYYNDSGTLNRVLWGENDIEVTGASLFSSTTRDYVQSISNSRHGSQPVLIAATSDVAIGFANDLNSASGAIVATLPDGTWIGQQTIFRCTDASNSTTLSVTTHETSSPEVFTFVLDQYLILQWNGNEWVTIAGNATV